MKIPILGLPTLFPRNAEFKDKRFISIKFKLITYFLLIATITTFIMAVTFYISSQILLEKKSSDLMFEIAKQSNNRIEEFLKDVEKLSLLTAYSSNIQDFLKNDNYANEVRAHEIIANWIQYKTKTFSIYVYNVKTGRKLYVNLKTPINFNYSPIHEKWFKKILVSEEPLTIVDTHRDLQTTVKPWVVATGRKIYSMDDGSLLGVMVINISIDFVDQVFGNILSNKQAILNIVNNQNVIIYNKEFKNIGRNLASLIPINPQMINRSEASYTLENNGKAISLFKKLLKKLNGKRCFTFPQIKSRWKPVFL